MLRQKGSTYSTPIGVIVLNPDSNDPEAGQWVTRDLCEIFVFVTD